MVERMGKCGGGLWGRGWLAKLEMGWVTGTLHTILYIYLLNFRSEHVPSFL